MNFNSDPRCEICRRPRAQKIHSKCSKIKQARALSKPKQNKRNQQTYDNERKLAGFLKTIGS